MLIRLRTNVGLWRIPDLTDSTTIDQLYAKIKETRPNLVFTKPLSLDPKCESQVLSDESKTLRDLKIVNGHMMYAFVDENSCIAPPEDSAAGGGSIIQKDGTIKKRSYEEASSAAGFRPGMMSLRSMKMQWTLNEFMAMDAQFSFKIQKQPEAFCKQVSLDSNSCNHFQNYMRMFNFQQTRFGFLYGSFAHDPKDEKNKFGLDRVKVECIYEPPQICNADGFEILEDENESRIEELAKLLGLQKVGWVVGHPPREEGFQLNANEVIMAAELQLEAANGVESTPFVTVKCTLDDDGNGHFDAFQVSTQCMEMAAEGALGVTPKGEPGFCEVAESFTAIVEGKVRKRAKRRAVRTPAGPP